MSETKKTVPRTCNIGSCHRANARYRTSTASKSCRKSFCRPRPQECTSMLCSNAKYTGTILLSFLRPGRQDEPNKCSVRWKVNINNYDTPTRGKVKASKGNGTYIRVGAPASFRETHNSTSMDHWENQVEHAYFRSYLLIILLPSSGVIFWFKVDNLYLTTFSHLAKLTNDANQTAPLHDPAAYCVSMDYENAQTNFGYTLQQIEQLIQVTSSPTQR